jgi:hypothetical protein
MRFFTTILLALLTTCLIGQTSIRPAAMVSNAYSNGERFTSTSLFEHYPNRIAAVTQEVEVHDLLQIDQNALSVLLRQQPQSMTFTVPSSFRNAGLELELVKVDLFAPDFQVTEATTGAAANVDLGIHYRGVVKGQPHSIAAISFFENDVMGVISTDADGNMVLGKLQGNRNQDLYILYPDKELLANLELECATPDDGKGYTFKELEPHPSRAPGDCVRLYFEVDYDIYQNKGGTQGATNYVTGIYNEVATLYANESINTSLSEIFVWNTTSPFSSNSSSGMLSDFQSYHNNSSWNGDLGQLLSYQASGGIAAGFSGLCNSNRDNSLSFSNITSSYSSVPTYSWTIMVVTHEFGHLWGSRHTHACVWNGNNTAIDGCAGQTEGSCSLPGYPSSGGTIMSYCHLQSVGINFNNGFGPQPGNVIRNSVANANCLTACGPPTCTDGIQNGNETGVDCGGPDCPACPPCDNDVTLTIVLDNYPGETSWDVRDGNGSVFASGGGYGSQPNGSTVVENFCLPDGCYDFTIYDSYGDGICCSYGSGSYTLTDDSDGSTLASGGAFGSSETTNFCVSNTGGGGDTTPPSAPTNLNASNPTTSTIDLSWNASSDNVGVDGYNVYMDGSLLGTVAGTSAQITGLAENTTYSFYVTAYDAAGNVSSASNTDSETTLSSGGGGCSAGVIDTESFESGWGNWNDGGGDCTRRNEPARSWDGNYSIRIRDNSGTASSMTSDAYDLSEYSSVDLEFYFYPNSMENGEDFWVRVNNGSGWTTVATYAAGSSFNNNSFYTATVNFPASSLSANTQFRFQCDASANADRIYIDQVTITGNCSGLLPGFNKVTSTITELKTPKDIEDTYEAVTQLEVPPYDVNIYPNPTRSHLNIAAPDVIESVMIFGANGAQLATHGKIDNNASIDVSMLQPGLYFISIKTETGIVNKKFVKTE